MSTRIIEKVLGKLFTSKTSRREALLEGLEERTLFSLLGVVPDAPYSYVVGAAGSLTYTAATQSFDDVASPITLTLANGSTYAITTPKDFQLHIKVDSAGNLVGGGNQANDLIVTGSIDTNNDGTPDYSGTLLTASVQQFGFLDDGVDDAFDFHFVITGGSLAPLYAGSDLGLYFSTENSTFDGTFTGNFQALTKGNLGAIPGIPNNNVQPMSISGTKFLDLTGNGKTPDDTPLAGTTINLFVDSDNSGTLNAGDQLVASTVTADGTGTYLFSGLNVARYFVQEVVPDGYAKTFPVASYYTINGASGQDFTGYDFANQKLNTITGTKYLDLTGNGFSCDDTGLGGVTIKLYADTNNSGKLNCGDALVTTTVTAADGTYSFNNLKDGRYFVQEVVPAGYIRTGPVCTDNYTINASGGQTFSGNDFDNYKKTCTPCPEKGYASLAGKVWLDCNNNGKVDSNEKGIANVAIKLVGTTTTGGSVTLYTTTDCSGNYKFSNLKAGTYKVIETQPPQYLDGKDALGSAGGILGNDQDSNIVLGNNTAATGYNFGGLKGSSLCGKVYLDCHTTANMAAAITASAA